jgi:O-methyltransferase
MRCICSILKQWGKIATVAIASKLNLYATEQLENYIYVDRNRVTDNSPPRMSVHQPDEFMRLATSVIESGRTLLRFQRLCVIWQAMQNVKHLRLPAAEVGAYKGGSAYFIAAGFERICGGELPVHVFDTFHGHPECTSSHFTETHHATGRFSDTSLEAVRSYLARFEKLVIHPGDFLVTSTQLPSMKFGFVHLDADTYVATSAGLNYFFPRLACGGVIVLDDFGSGKCGGVIAAYEEFMASEPPCQVWQPFTEQCVISKR